MAYIRRQRKTTKKFITKIASIEVHSSSHSPETGELVSLEFKLPGKESLKEGAPETFYIVTVSRQDIQDLWVYLIDAESRRSNK